MPAILPLTRTVPLLACALTFSLGTTFLQAEPPASLAPVSLLVEEKSATSDSGAAAVPSPTESAVPLPSSFGGPFGERLKLTGDWFGVRDKLDGSGITLDVNLTQFFQGVASGGNDRAFKYGGKIDYFLNIDGKKAGLWKGFFVTMHAETRYGEDVNGIDGMFSFGNFNMASEYVKPGVDLVIMIGARDFGGRLVPTSPEAPPAAATRPCMPAPGPMQCRSEPFAPESSPCTSATCAGMCSRPGTFHSRGVWRPPLISSPPIAKPNCDVCAIRWATKE